MDAFLIKMEFIMAINKKIDIELKREIKRRQSKTVKVSPTAKQKKLIDLSIKSNTKVAHNIYGVFLVRQGLRARSEQFMGIAISYTQATKFCRSTLTPKYCSDNEKVSLHFVTNDERIRVNYSNDLLMIKGLDFVRTEQGRMNANPTWYWNIAKINVIKDIQ